MTEGGRLTGSGSTFLVENRCRRDLTLVASRRMRKSRRDEKEEEGDQGFSEGRLAGELNEDMRRLKVDVERGWGGGGRKKTVRRREFVLSSH